MSFFELLKNIVTDPNDRISNETEGVVSGNSMILDGASGTLHIKPNIPKFHLSKTSAEKFKQGNDFLTGRNRRLIQEPIDPKTRMGDDTTTSSGAISGTTSDSDPNIQIETLGGLQPDESMNRNFQKSQDQTGQAAGLIPTESPSDTINPALPKATETDGRVLETNPPSTEGSIPDVPVDRLLQLVTQMTPQDVQNMSSADVQSLSKQLIDSEAIPVPPELKKVPGESEAKNTKKWKDILVGILNNISNADMSKVAPDQRLGAFLGAIAGGAAEGASTGRYAGKVQNRRERAEAEAENQKRLGLYNQQMDLYSKRINNQNAALKPQFEQQKIDLAVTREENKKMRDASTMELKTKQAESIMQDRINRQILNDKKFEFLKGAGWQKVTRQMSDGSYQLMVINKQGEEIPVASTDGQAVKLADPTEVARFLKGVEAERDIAEGSSPTVSPDERKSMMETERRIISPDYDQLQQQLKDPDISARKKAEISRRIESINARAAQSVDRQIKEKNDRSRQKSRGRATRKAVKGSTPKRSSTGRSTIDSNLDGIDFATQFKNRKK